MITFTCGGCGRSFTIPDHFAGRRANCKNCSAPITVPAPAEPPVAVQPHATPPVAPAPMPHPPTAVDHAHAAPPVPRIPMRHRRLTADAEQMAAAFANFPLIRVVSTAGSPPDRYQIEYHVNSLERPTRNKLDPVPRQTHLVEIQLAADYPRVSPMCKMLTPVFHPNIDPSHICVGDHWTAGERLADLVVRIGEMLAYQAYNIQSPLDAEAAMWADLNLNRLPTDPRPLRPPDME